jgi:hypothetical protein
MSSYDHRKEVTLIVQFPVVPSVKAATHPTEIYKMMQAASLKPLCSYTALRNLEFNPGFVGKVQNKKISGTMLLEIQGF